MCWELTFLIRPLGKPGSTRALIRECPKIPFPTLARPQYVMCHSHFLLLRMHITVASEIMLQARRNANFWNGKMIACTVIAGYHKCQSYFTARQNKGWPQFEAVKLHSNQNKNKKSLTQMYFFCFLLEIAKQPSLNKSEVEPAKMQVSPPRRPWPGAFGLSGKEREKKIKNKEHPQTWNILYKNTSNQAGQRETGTAESGIALQRPGAMTEFVWYFRSDLISTHGHFVYGIKSVTRNECIDLAHNVALHYFSKS